VQLYFRQSGSDLNPPLLFLHGLFGSSANWGRIARHFEADYHCIIPDLRNHGRSPHDADTGYKAQAADVWELMQQLSIDSATFIGHSMGGKVAMTQALTQPHSVNSMVVVDIAPVHYAHRFTTIFTTLQQLDLLSLQDRTHADSQLAQSIDEPEIRAYLLQNLARKNGRWQWRINLDFLCAGIDALMDFPDYSGCQYAGSTLFLHGEGSSYVDQSGRQAAIRLFPNADFVEVENAGHWVYAEQPERFIQYVEAFLRRGFKF
jgi:pimeloyl-ACP methyl ester carboxylesterase